MRTLAKIPSFTLKVVLSLGLVLLLNLGLSACGSSGGSVATVDVDPGAPSGFLTQQASLVAPMSNAQITPIITVGDFPLSPEATSGSELETFAPVPDGVGAFVDGDDVVVFVNHEINAVGQTFGSPGIDTEVEGESAFVASRVSRLVLNRTTLGVLDLSYPVNGSENYARLCSGTYDDNLGLWLAGEEAQPSPNGDIAIAVTSDGSSVIELPCLGRISHENATPIPYPSGQIVIIGTDDAFPPDQDSLSELYLFVADSQADLLSCNGRLFVLGSPEAAVSGALANGQTVETTWIEIPDPFMSFDALQDFVDQNGALSFVRLEDADFDRRPGVEPAFYFADTGDADVTGNSRINASCDGICDFGGSLYRMALDPTTPEGPGSLTLVARSDGPSGFWASPDNIATSPTSIMIQEDPNSRVGFDDFRNGGIWNCPLIGDGIGFCTEVARLNDAGGETSGIVNVADIFGPGSWLFATQAHDVPQPLLGLAEENGQLSLLNVPGT